MSVRPLVAMLGVIILSPWCHGAPLLQNGGFEALQATTPGADGLVANWKLATPAQVPVGWNLNTAYPGSLAIGTEKPHSGKSFVRLTGSAKSGHLYQMCVGLKAGQWYRVSAWARGGPLGIDFYEYYPDHIGGQAAALSARASEDWRLVTGFYRPAGLGYIESALALVSQPGQPVEVDDVTLEPLALPPLPAGAGDITIENDLLRVTITPGGVVREFRCKPSGKDYAADARPYPILSALRGGIATPLYSLTCEGSVLQAQFLDPEVRASVRFTIRKQHILFEVTDVHPADLDQLTLGFPMKRLNTVAWAFDGNYDDEFGACMFGTTVNAHNAPDSPARDIQSLGGTCYRKHGIVGAKFALVGAPADRFKPAIMEAERDNGVPCPMLEGKWARDSEPVRRSYLFAVDASEANLDKIIEYAKVGHFGMIIFLKDNWAATTGHYEINKTNFPDGRASLKRAVQKIHAAGMGAGVHVFGPSISPNDRYVTPKPDDRLASIPCPPLAEAVDAKGATLTLTGQPEAPPKQGRSESFPDYYLRIGDEIIRYAKPEVGPPFRYTGCVRGALGTRATAHPAGAEVKHLEALWGFFVCDPDSTLADEITRNFADVINDCDFDMVYMDASDNGNTAYMDWWYYLNKLHLGFYTKFKQDILYQTSMGTGTDICWHIIPRSASADGHGDLKRYLDERLPGMLGMAANWTRSDVGWYYMYNDVRPDQIEYVCSKTLGTDGSFSIESSRASMEQHPRARQMMEMLAQYEQCRLSRYFPQSVLQKLVEPGKDFKLFPDGKGGWSLYRAAYEEPRVLDALDGEQNTWTLNNPLPDPCLLGVEISRGSRLVPSADYDDPKALTIEDFSDMAAYRLSERNQYEKFVQGGEKMLTEGGPVRQGVTQSFKSATADCKVGPTCAVYSAENKGGAGGWGGVGRRFAKPLNLSASKALALWINGDGKGEVIRFQLWDTAGHFADWLPAMNYKGWRLHIFRLADAPGFDWSKVDYLLFYFNNIPAETSVQVRFDGLRAVPTLRQPAALGELALDVNGQRLAIPLKLQAGQALTSAGPEGMTLWPGGMTPGEKLNLSNAALTLKPGENKISLTCDVAQGFPGDVNVLLYRMWPLEK